MNNFVDIMQGKAFLGLKENMILGCRHAQEDQIQGKQEGSKRITLVKPSLAENDNVTKE